MRRNLLINGALLLCSVALYSVSTELATRVYFFGWSSLHPAVLRSIPTLAGHKSITRQSALVGLPFELIPNNSTLFKKVPLVTNADGMRDQTYTLKKPSGIFRVAVIGDSFTMPDGVAIEDAYHSVLEEKFNGLGNEIRYEFLNFGVGGYDLRNYLTVMQNKVMKYNPDLILIGFCPWNDHKIDYIETGKPGKDIRFVFLATLSAELYGKRREWMWHMPRQEEIMPVNKEVNQFADKLSQVFTEIGDFGREEHIPIVIASLSFQKSNQKLIALYQEHEKKNDFVFFDTSERFPENMREEGFVVSRGDTHMNGKANRILADAIFDFLTEKKLVPAS